jgi:uncharacterized protein with beta-barrel porin domain
VVEAGIEALVDTNVTLGLSYSGEVGGGTQDHGFRANLTWNVLALDCQHPNSRS